MRGNLITLAERGEFDVIVHGCNCFHTMGAGIAGEIRRRYPAAYIVDKTETKRGDSSKLGGYTYVYVNGFYIVNAYTQYDYLSDYTCAPLADYKAITSVFKAINKDFSGSRIGYPKIGCGLAKGDWKIVSEIINKELTSCWHALVLL